MNWLASLNGNSVVLYNLDMMTSPHFSVFNDSEDHQGELYYLRSEHFKGIADHQKIYSSTIGLIQLINGAAAIQWGFNAYARKGNITLDRLFYTTERRPADSDWHPAKVSGEIAPSNPFIGNPEILRFLNPFRWVTTGCIELCLEHEDIFNLLRQISMGFDWRNLYCIWDSLCHYSGGSKKIIDDLELDEVQIKAFTGTANNFGVLGLEARHGVMGWQIPKNTVNHEEAIDIVNNVVTKYLKNKVCLKSQAKKWDSQFDNPTQPADASVD